MLRTRLVTNGGHAEHMCEDDNDRNWAKVMSGKQSGMTEA